MTTIWDFFFAIDSARLLGTVVNVIIIVVGLVSVTELVRSIRQTLSDRRALVDFTAQAIKGGGAEDLTRLALSLPRHHLLHRRIHTLTALREVAGEVDPATFAGMAVAELDRGARWTKWASTTVVLFGLGGTLLGLSQAVMNAQPILGEIVSAPAAVQAVIGTFSGLATAFSTTLMGIFWAVSLGIGLGMLRREQGQYLQHLEELCMVLVYPKFRTSPSQAIAEAASQLTKVQQTLTTSLSQLLSDVRIHGLALTKMVEDSVGGLTSRIELTGSDLRSSVQTAMTELVGETHERGVALTTSVDRSFASLTDELRSGTKDLLTSVSALAADVRRLVGTPAENVLSFTDSLAVLERGSKSMTEASEHMKRMALAVEEAVARQVDRQSRDLHDTMHAYTGKLATSLEKQEQLVGDGFQRLEKGIGGFGDALLEQLEAHQANLDERQDRAFEAKLQQMEEGIGRFGVDILAQLQAHDTGLVTELGQHVQSVAAAVEEQKESARQVGAAIERLIAILGNTPTVVPDLRALGEIQKTAAELVSGLSELASDVKQLKEALELSARVPRTNGYPETRPVQVSLPPVFAGTTEPSSGRNIESGPPPSTPGFEGASPSPAPPPRPLYRPPEHDGNTGRSEKKPGFFARLFGGK